MGAHTGSCCLFASSAKPMVGVCEVAMPPTIVAMYCSVGRDAQSTPPSRARWPAREGIFACGVHWRQNGNAVSRTVKFLAFLALTARSQAGEDLPLLRPILSTDTVLVVAPHPDDESLCCGGLIHQARASGAHVAVVWLTYGDGFRWSAMVAQRKLRPRAVTYRELANRRASE